MTVMPGEGQQFDVRVCVSISELVLQQVEVEPAMWLASTPTYAAGSGFPVTDQPSLPKVLQLVDPVNDHSP